MADFIGVMCLIHDSWSLILSHKLAVNNLWHSNWKFSTWVNVSTDDIEDSFRELLTSKEVLDLSINIIAPFHDSSSWGGNNNDGFSTFLFVDHR